VLQNRLRQNVIGFNSAQFQEVLRAFMLGRKPLSAGRTAGKLAEAEPTHIGLGRFPNAMIGSALTARRTSSKRQVDCSDVTDYTVGESSHQYYRKSQVVRADIVACMVNNPPPDGGVIPLPVPEA